MSSTFISTTKRFFERCYRLIQVPFPNPNVSRKIEFLLKEVGKDARVLEIGSGRKRRGNNIVNIDCQLLPNVDIVGDAHRLPLKGDSFDAVIAQAVFEHVREPLVVASESGRVLKKRGYIYAEIPFLQPFHAAPTDYQRYTLQGIEYLFKDFNKIETGICVGPTSALCSIMMEYIPFVVGIPVLRSIVYVILGWVLFPLRYLDLLLARKKNAHILASSLYYFGQK